MRREVKIIKDGYGHKKDEVKSLIFHEAMLLIAKGFALLVEKIEAKIEAKQETKKSKAKK